MLSNKRTRQARGLVKKNVARRYAQLGLTRFFKKLECIKRSLTKLINKACQVVVQIKDQNKLYFVTENIQIGLK